jgi:hypothetical protein
LLWRKRVVAADHWRNWHYQPRCGRHYHVRYITFAFTYRFNVWVQRARS